MKKSTLRKLQNATYICVPTGFKKKGIDWDEAAVIINFVKTVSNSKIYKTYTSFEVPIDKEEFKKRGYMYWLDYETKWGLVLACIEPLSDHHYAILKDLGYKVTKNLKTRGNSLRKLHWKEL